jgi:hypothetical protein
MSRHCPTLGPGRGDLRPYPAVAAVRRKVIGVTAAASLPGWLLLAQLERRTPRARLLWTTIALAAPAASLALPLAAATTSSAVTGLIVMHLTVGTVVIPAMARTARTR